MPSVAERSGCRQGGPRIFIKLFTIVFGLAVAVPSIIHKYSDGQDRSALQSKGDQNSGQNQHHLYEPEQQKASRRFSTYDIEELPLSEDEARQFCHSLEAAVLSSDTDPVAFTEQFCHPAVLHRAFGSLPLEARERIESILPLSDLFGPVTNGILQAVGSGGDFKLVRIERFDGDFRPLFRLISVDPADVNYYEMVLRRCNGDLRVVDAGVGSDGQMMSQMIGDGVRRMARLLDRTVQIYANDPDAVFAERIAVVGKLVREESYVRALNAISDFPAEWKTDRVVMLTKCRVAEKVGELEFEQSCDEIGKVFPNERATLLMKLRLFRRIRQHTEVIACVRQLMEDIQDPYLGVFMVPALLELGRRDDAEVVIQVAKDAADHRIEPWRLELEMSMSALDYSRTDEVIAEMEKRFPDADLRLSSLSGFDKFAESKPGSACLARRAGF